MNNSSKLAVLMAAAAIVAMNGDAVSAQGLFGNDGYNYYPARYFFQLTLVRIAMMIGSVGAGFALGWFLSPQAKELRQIVMIGLACLAITVAILNHGMIGWGTAWLVSFIGFFAALGYWVGRGVKAMLQTPTTFGSSQWASVDEMIDKDLFGWDGIVLGLVTVDDPIGQAVEHVFSYKGDRHLLTSAPTRSGKGVSHIVLNLLNWTCRGLMPLL